MASRETRTFPAKMNALPLATAFIEEVSAAVGFRAEIRHKLTLVLEELLTNTVVHGHGGDSEEQVQLTLETGAEQVTLRYEDNAPPYNPFDNLNMPDPSIPLEEQPIGGLGVVLVANLARHVEYSYSEGRNQITLTFITSTPSEPPVPGQ
jgi:anti-sigma regulatory factor (Ser/Thr protein kinase)